MTTFTVTTSADTVNASDGVLSLREAVQLANDTAGDDTIQFTAALEGQTLTLTQGQLTIAGGPGSYDNRLSIDGDADNNGTRVTLSGGDQSRILECQDSSLASLSDIVLRDGNIIGGSGGGILVGQDGNLHLTNVRVTSCSASLESYYGAPHYQGGGISAGRNSSLYLVGCEIDRNYSNDGGGIASTGSVSINNSYIHHNRAGGYDMTTGGGVKAATAYINNSTISYNTASYGGGVAGSALIIHNSSLVGNTANGFISEFDGEHPGAGGAIYGSNVSIYGSTITGNRAGYGGISALNLRISDSIAAGNGSAGYSNDIGGIGGGAYGSYQYPNSLTYSNGHNIFGSFVRGSAPGDLEDVATARLFAAIDAITGGGRLALNGGPTPTVALRNALDNPALGGASPDLLGTADQRGVLRPAPGTTNPDVGAFELNQTAISTTPTPGNDVLTGTAAADVISGLAGVDLIRGLGGDDRLYGNDGGDTLRGEAGNDLLEGGLGSDILDGGAGSDKISYANDAYPLGVQVHLYAGTDQNDVDYGLVFRGSETDRLLGIEDADGSNFNDLIVGDGNNNRLGGAGGQDRLLGSSGSDVLNGGLGNDRLNGGRDYNDTDTDLADYGNGGAVTVDLAAGRATRGSEVDTLVEIEGAIGSANADTFRGDAGANLFRGLAGKDVQTGGAGNDLFDFDAVGDSPWSSGKTTCDRITDFTHLTDKIDLSTIDAKAATAVNDAFTFLATKGAAITAVGQVHWYQANGNTYIEANTTGDTRPELQIQLDGLKTITAADFML